MIFYIRDRMLEVLLHSYPDFYDKYKTFLVKCSYKEVRKNSKYYFEDRTVIINNLSRESGDIFISTLFSLAEHIDIVNRRETHLDWEYFMIVKKLLHTAMERNLFTLDQLTKYSDRSMCDRLQKEFSTFKNWSIKEVEFEPSYIYIYVYESFMLKNVLKTNNYLYDREQGLWIKKIRKHEMLEEQQFTDRYKNEAIFKVIGDNSFFVNPVYILKLKTYSKEDAPLLKALEYMYSPSMNVWSKLIQAREVIQEMKNVEHIPKQSLKISDNKTNLK